MDLGTSRHDNSMVKLLFKLDRPLNDHILVVMPVIRHGILNEPAPNDTIWRYMSLSKFKDLLATGQLYLCRLDKFEVDPQDGVVPERNYAPEATRKLLNIDLTIVGFDEKGQIMIENNSGEKSVTLRDFYGVSNFERSVREEKAKDLQHRKSMFASCWHKNSDENLVFWHNYKSVPTVAIKTSVRNLVDSVFESRERLYLSDVQYFDEGRSIPSQNGFHQASHKRKKFEFEKEVRLLYWCHRTSNCEKAPSEDYRVNINTKRLISEVWMSPYGDYNQSAEAQELMKLYGINAELKKSVLF